MDTLKERVISAYTRENYPNAKIEKWDDPDSSLQFYTARELEAVEGDWFPLCCYRDPATGETVYGGRKGVVHTYTEGETGAGKTSRFAMQSIRALSATKGKPSFVVVDIHGELVENLYDHLRSGGYEVRILNCDDPSRSDTYNPFAPLVRRCEEQGEMDNETVNQIRRIAEIMQPTESTEDPIWDQGARSYANGLILDKFEDLLAGNIPPEAITIYNIIENHYWLRNQVTGTFSQFSDIAHYKKKKNALSVQKIMSVTNNAEKTRASYFGVVENHFDVFGQPSLYQLSSNSTIDIDRFIDRPTAIFIQSGTTRVGDDLISLLMNEIYHTAVRIGRTSPTKMLPRKIHCFLDEFANSDIAEGPEFIRMLTTSRKFGMYWHMLLQCDAQLERKFDNNIGRIIRANCTEIFMGSHDHETMVRFARSCGQKTVESLSSLVAAQSPSLDTVDLVTPDKLSLTPEGYVYIKSNRRPLLYSYIEAFFNCPEFKRVEDISAVYPVNEFDYKSTVFYPDDIPTSMTETEFRIVQFLYCKGPTSLEKLNEAFPKKHPKLWLELLQRRGVVKRADTARVYSCELKPAAYYLLVWRFPDVNLPDLPYEGVAQEAAEPNDALVEALYKKLKAKRKGTLCIEQRAGDLECLPRDLVRELGRLEEEAQVLMKSRYQALRDPFLHYRIARTFLVNNDFMTRDGCIKNFFRECRTAEQENLVPAELVEKIRQAMKVIMDLDDGEVMALKQALEEE